MVMSWLLNDLNLDLANIVIYVNTPIEVWSDLHDRFSLGILTRAFWIHGTIAEYKQRQQTVSQYYTKIKSLWDEMSSYNSLPNSTCEAMKTLWEPDEEEQVLKFLMDLNDSYKVIRGHILLMPPLPIVKKVYFMVMQEGKQCEVGERNVFEAVHAMNVGKK